ncbi:MAG: NYN domain-containing protein [Actinomycetota bacterium]
MSRSPQGVHLFWDNSNMFVPAKDVAESREGIHARYDVRIQFDALYALARAGRPVTRGVCVGSVPPDLGGVFRHLASTGVEVELYERGAGSGREQGIDQCLQTHMLRAGYDYEPGVAVLLTGDGAGYEEGRGFRADLERLVERGWAIEVISWRNACNRGLRELGESSGVFVGLDDYYDAVTFWKRADARVSCRSCIGDGPNRGTHRLPDLIEFPGVGPSAPEWSAWPIRSLATA